MSSLIFAVVSSLIAFPFVYAFLRKYLRDILMEEDPMERAVAEFMCLLLGMALAMIWPLILIAFLTTKFTTRKANRSE